MDVTITPAGGSINVEALYNREVAVDTAVAELGSDVEYLRKEPKGTQLYERYEGSGSGSYLAVEFYRSLSGTDLTGLPAGDLWLDVYTDYNGGTIDHTNYLVGGIWVFLPDDGTADDYEFGAFVDGPEPFNHDIPPLTGEAMYQGEANGVYSTGEEGIRRNLFFDASAELTADFGTVDNNGTIQGRIHGFEFDDGSVRGISELTLGEADILPIYDGFTGTTSATHDGVSYSGMWGGQFFNEGATRTDLPLAVAGTFGAADVDETETIVGVFGARKP